MLGRRTDWDEPIRVKDVALCMETLMSPSENHVVVVDVQMPFMSMVRFMVKWSIAAIPAFVILLLIGALIVGMLGGAAGLAALTAP